MGARVVRGVADQGVSLGSDSITIANRSVSIDNHSIVLVSRNPIDASQAVAWIAADPVTGIPALAKAIPRYGSSSYLAFRGRDAENEMKGTWAISSSPLTRSLSAGSLAELDLAPTRPIADIPSPFTVKDLGRLVESVALGFGATARLKYMRSYPATINSEREAVFAADVAAGIVGEQHVVRSLPPSMGAEDFSFMLQVRPGAYLRLGQGGEGSCFLHNSRYDFNDEVLPLGAALFASLVERGLPAAQP